MPRGRLPGPPELRRAVTIRFRCTAADQEKMETAAEAAGMTLSAWMRARLLRDNGLQERRQGDGERDE